MHSRMCRAVGVSVPPGRQDWVAQTETLPTLALHVGRRVLSMVSVTLFQVLAQSGTSFQIPDGGTKGDAVSGLLVAFLLTGVLLALCVPAARRERWPLVALLGLLILGTQAGLLFFITQILANPPV